MITAPPHEDCQPIFESEAVRIGRAHCRPDSPTFRRPGPVQRHAFLFPRSQVQVRHLGQRPFLANSSLVTFYNAGESVEREAISRDGDQYECFHVQDSLLMEVLAHCDPSLADRPEAPFPFVRGPANATVCLLEQTLMQYVSNAPAPDTLFVEESIVRLLHRVVGLACKAHRGDRRRGRPSTLLRHRELVEQARRLLADRLHRSVELGEIARAVGCSRFHLCRVFHEQMNMSLTTYREHLRLTRALQRTLEETVDLTSVALSLGYSSHSHMTYLFRRHFGVPPSRLRRWSTRRHLSRFRTEWKILDDSALGSWRG